ncbi:MAG TPA: NAD(P)-binding domain-containing protein [Spirochaetia bacterium]|nr:NAD(P)-binding domain-containing protein [Spirochaetia bacterium]
MEPEIRRVGCIGLGVMGGNMARHLAAKFEVTVFDADPGRMAGIDGVRRAESIASLSQKIEAAVLSLPGSPIVREVVLGAGGLRDSLAPGSFVIDLSTTEPSVSREVAAALAQKSIAFLDAPVSGGEKGAREATLSIMVGGAQVAFDRCRPLLETIGSSVVRIGDVGMGEIAKLVNNMIVASTFTVIAEGFALAAKNGVDPAILYKAIKDGWAGSKVLDVSAPGMVEGNFTPGGTVNMMLKDIGYALSLASESSIPVPATSQANEVFKAAKAAGFGAEAQQAIIKVWEVVTGITVGKRR